MEDEDAPIVQTTSENNALTDLAANETSLIKLIGTLLSPKTLPHLALITLLSTLLYSLANTSEGRDIAALGFISLSLGYAITALLSNNERVKSWITLDKSIEEERPNLVTRLFTSFKICLFPSAVAGVLAILILILFGGEGILDLPAAFALGLGSLFVLWAVAQGRSFGSWASSRAAKKLPKRQATSGNIKVMIAIQLVIVLGLSVIGIMVFESIYEKQFETSDAVISNLGFFLAALTLYGLTVAWTWNYRQIALRDKALKQFSSRWTLFAHVFATWHLLTVWRQLFMTPGTVEVFIEEVLLMMFTVFMAIWSITSQSVGEKFKLLSTENALPWGLSFGYAYAGSVAMLASFNNLSNITTVMVTGHIIALLTITWMQRSVLVQILDQHDLVVSSERSSLSSATPTEIEKTDLNPIESVETVDEESTEEPTIDVEWDGNVGPSISEDVEWDDVIELSD